VHVPKEKGNNLDKKVVKCIFIGYKDGMKGYKLWDPTSRKIVYNRDVVFKEVGGTSKFEEVQIEKELEKLVFEPSNEEDDSDKSIELDEGVEQLTLVVRRYE
jgi:hypothetical protein